MEAKHIPNPRIEERKKIGPHLTKEEHVGFNGRLAVLITNMVSTMWCAYIFAAIALIIAGVSASRTPTPAPATTIAPTPAATSAPSVETPIASAPIATEVLSVAPPKKPVVVGSAKPKASASGRPANDFDRQ